MKHPAQQSGFLDGDLEKERERLHQQILSSVSHDLKTPLASIIGSLEIHQRMKDVLPQAKKEILIETALEEARRLDNFISNILDMAKLENGMIKTKPENCNIGQLIQQCLKRLDTRITLGQVSVVAPGMVPELNIDSALVGRVLMLLLDNAIKYAPESKIEIHYKAEGGTLEIAVRDYGKGVPSGRHREIFSKYTRLHKQDSQVAGTGLGLAIARMIARLHGGDITLTPHITDGAEFIATFHIYP